MPAVIIVCSVTDHLQPSTVSAVVIADTTSALCDQELVRSGGEHIPESVEFGVTSFVFRYSVPAFTGAHTVKASNISNHVPIHIVMHGL